MKEERTADPFQLGLGQQRARGPARPSLPLCISRPRGVKS